MGLPLSARADDSGRGRGIVDTDDGIDTCLTRHLEGVSSLLEQVYGETEAAVQAVHEMRLVARMAPCPAATTCKRAALLFALHREPEVRRHFHDQAIEHAVAIATPEFERHSCQSPEQYVALCAVLSELWGEEALSVQVRTRTTIPPDGS